MAGRTNKIHPLLGTVLESGFKKILIETTINTQFNNSQKINLHRSKV